MEIELIIRGASLSEILNEMRTTSGAVRGATREEAPRRPEADKAAEVSAAVRMKEVGIEEAPEETAAPKKPRGRGKTASADTATEAGGSTASPTSDTATAGKAEATSTSDEKVTFEDLRAASNKLMEKGVAAKDIQALLEEKFGVKAFGPLPEESYAACLNELENYPA